MKEMGVTIGTRTTYFGTCDYSTGEETVFDVDAKSEVYMVEGFIDLSEMAAGDTYVIKEYVKIDGTNYRCYGSRTFSGAQAEPALRFHTKTIPCSVADDNMDWKITIEKTAGTVRDFDYSFVVCDYLEAEE